jgi:hypothetical protein
MARHSRPPPPPPALPTRRCTAVGRSIGSNASRRASRRMAENAARHSLVLRRVDSALWAPQGVGLDRAGGCTGVFAIWQAVDDAARQMHVSGGSRVIRASLGPWECATRSSAAAPHPLTQMTTDHAGGGRGNACAARWRQRIARSLHSYVKPHMWYECLTPPPPHLPPMVVFVFTPSRVIAARLLSRTMKNTCTRTMIHRIA